MYYSYINSSMLIIKTMLCPLTQHFEFATCNLYNNILIKSANQFLQCSSFASFVMYRAQTMEFAMRRWYIQVQVLFKRQELFNSIVNTVLLINLNIYNLIECELKGLINLSKYTQSLLWQMKTSLYYQTCLFQRFIHN